MKKLNPSRLNTPVTFYEYKTVDGPYPDEEKEEKVYSCWAQVDRVWMKDIEEAKQNNTMSDVTIKIRDPLQEFMPDNKHYIKIETFDYGHLVYNVQSSRPNLKDRQFITIVGKLKDDMRWA